MSGFEPPQGGHQGLKGQAPATPGLHIGSSSSSAAAGTSSSRLGPLFQRLQATKAGRAAQFGYKWRRTIFFSFGVTYALIRYTSQKRQAKKRDWIHDKTYLYWKIYDGGIVEAKSTGSSLNYLLTSSAGSPEEPPRVMTLFEVIRTLKFAEADDRIHGIIADFSSTSVPTVPSYTLGLAQLEEIQDALLELKRVKKEKMGDGKDGWRTIAWSDSFTSQGQFLLASAFDEVWSQPTGEVPLVGMGATLPFFGKLAKWLGIEVHAEARREYKSFVQPYIDEKFTDPQRENQQELINDLNDNLMTYIGRNRYPDLPAKEARAKLKEMSKNGPYSAREAAENGLLTGTCYRQDILHSLLEEEKGGDPERKLKGFYHYAKTMERIAEKSGLEAMDVGVVYLLGTIGEPGEFGTASVVRGLKEAAEDEEIGAVVLRLDTGGGGVIDSDTIWSAVRDLRDKGKTVVASFGNSCASGGYLVSTHTDAILAAPSTITGSIGVASLRPTILQTFFDRFNITLESFFTGSRANDLTHSLTPAEKERHSKHVDEMYDDFKNRVIEGRSIHPDLMESLAGGRVMTGLKAFSLVAPPEIIDSIRDFEPFPGEKLADDKKKGDELPSTTSTSEVVLAESPLEGKEVSSVKDGKDSVSTSVQTVVEVSSDQETSPYAPPETSGIDVSQIEGKSTSKDKDEAAVHAEQALATASPEDLKNAEPLKRFEIKVGPMGRGLVDGLGGIRDAAIHACEIYIANGIMDLKEEHPHMSDEQAVRQLLPHIQTNVDQSGELQLQLDVRLKQFPVQKSFWQQIQEASRRGDAMDFDTLSAYAARSLALWFAEIGRNVISNELSELGITAPRSVAASLGANGNTASLGLGNESRRHWLRAQWQPSFR